MQWKENCLTQGILANWLTQGGWTRLLGSASPCTHRIANFIVHTSSCNRHVANFIVHTSSCNCHVGKFVLQTLSCKCRLANFRWQTSMPTRLCRLRVTRPLLRSLSCKLRVANIVVPRYQRTKCEGTKVPSSLKLRLADYLVQNSSRNLWLANFVLQARSAKFVL